MADFCSDREKVMVGNSSNLVDLIRSHLTGDVSNRILGLVGGSRENAQAGMNAAVPGILSGLERTGSTAEGSQRLASAVDGSDDTMLSKISQMFGGTPSSEGGVGMLRSVLGEGGLSELVGNIGRSSGLSGTGVTSLLGYVAPIVFGVLKNVKRTQGLDAAGLSNLLSSQKSSFAAPTPESGRVERPVESTSYAREPLRDVSSRAPQREVERRPEAYTQRAGAERSSIGWVLPLLIFLGLIGLLWHWGTRPAVQAGRETSPVTTQAGRLGTTRTLDTLKTKYQSVIDQAQAQGVQITSLDQQNGKLTIKGTAPSLEAANKVWDEIKKINPSMDDIVADFPVTGQSGASTQ
jgi:hypothetical protein